MTHKCYSCHNNFEYKDLEYECMCYNNDTIKYRGICKICKDIPIQEWKTKPDDNHHLQKIQRFSEEWKKWNNHLNDYAGKYLWSIDDNPKIFGLCIPIKKYDEFVSRDGFDDFKIIEKEISNNYMVKIEYKIPEPVSSL